MMWAVEEEGKGKGKGCWAQNCSIIVAKAVSIYFLRSFCFVIFVLFIVIRLVRRTRDLKEAGKG